MRAHRWHAVLLFLTVFFMQAARADQVMLANGDRLTGTVISKADDTLTFETEYAGKIKIRWKDVVSLITDGPVTVMSAEGKLQKGRLERTASGSLELVTDAGSRPVRLADMSHINPPPHVAGTGVTYNGRVTLMASASRGNTDDGRLYGEAAMRARAKQYNYGVEFNAEQKQESGETTAQNYWLAGRYNRVIDKERFAYVRSSLSHDEFTDIQLRGTVGAGLGWNFFDTEKTHLSVLGGLEYVATDRSTGVSVQYPAFGWGIEYRQWVWGDRLELFFNQYGFTSLVSRGDTSFKTRGGVRIPLGSNLTANAQVNYNYESDPGPDRDTTDVQLLLGLGYDF